MPTPWAPKVYVIKLVWARGLRQVSKGFRVLLLTIHTQFFLYGFLKASVPGWGACARRRGAQAEGPPGPRPEPAAAPRTEK